MSPARIARTFGRTVIHLLPSLLAISFMVGLAYVTRYSGMDTVLGLSLTRTGPAFPFFGTLLGWLGVALTGTDAGSNALFGNLQKVTAERLGISPILMASANSSGGVMGKMIDAQSIVVSSTATRQVGREAAIFKFVFKHSIALACLVGAIVMLYAFVFPGVIPAATPGQVEGGSVGHRVLMISLPARVPSAHQVWTVDRILDELHRAVAEGDVDAAGMVARRRDRRSDPAPGRIRDIGGRIRSAGAGDAVGRHEVRVGVVRGREVGTQEPLGSETAVKRRLRRPRHALAGGDEGLSVGRVP